MADPGDHVGPIPAITIGRRAHKGKGGAAVAPGNRPQYPLSGLLICGKCGAAMVASSGTSASYYICGDAKERGTCSNKLMLRDDVARRSIVGAVREALFTPAAVTFLRKKIAERLRSRAQTAETDAQ